MTNQPTF